MNKLNNYQVLFALHVVFFLTVVAFLNFDAFMSHDFEPAILSNMPVPIEFFFGLIFCLLLFILILVSWRGATDAPSERLKRYFRVFRWVGMNTLVMTLIILGAVIFGEIGAQHILFKK